MFTATLFIIVNNQKQPEGPSTVTQVECSTPRQLLHNKKEQANNIHNYMDES